MKIDFDIIDSVRQLINVPQVTALVSAIRPMENLPSDYSNKSKFIVINLLSGDAEQLQEGFVNINVYVPDINGIADYASLRAITNVLVPIIQDAYINAISIALDKMPKTMREQDVTGYHFSNIKIKFYNPNLN